MGGVETFSSYLAAGLSVFDRTRSPEHFNVTVVTQSPGRAVADGSSLQPFKIVRRPSLWSLWRLIGKADRVLLAGPAILPLLFALLRRKRAIVTHHGYQAICPNGMLFHFPTHRNCPEHFAARHYLECVKCNIAQDKFGGSARLLVLTFVRRLLSRLADLNVAVSEHVSRRIRLPNMRVIRNGVPSAAARTLPVSIDEQTAVSFAYLGRLVTEKGIPVLLEAASILKAWGRSFRLVIVGDGPEREALQRQVASLKLSDNVAFLGFQSGAKLDELMGRASALVMPSICEDAAPLAVLEQMMQGQLIIGSMLGGLAEEIGDAGLTFVPGDALALAEKMEEVIDRPEVAAQLGKEARERALRIYTLERMIYEYQSLLNERA